MHLPTKQESTPFQWQWSVNPYQEASLDVVSVRATLYNYHHVIVMFDTEQVEQRKDDESFWDQQAAYVAGRLATIAFLGT